MAYAEKTEFPLDKLRSKRIIDMTIRRSKKHLMKQEMTKKKNNGLYTMAVVHAATN